MKKRCNHCKNEKPLDDFNKNKSQKDGYDKRCRECAKKFTKKYNTKEKLQIDVKVCKICKIEKGIINYHKNISSKDGHHDICKDCRKLITKNYNSENREKVRESNLKWRKNNPNYKYLGYDKKRRQIDSNFKLKGNIRSLIKQTFKNNNCIKGKRTTEILGCSIEEFREFISKQFLNWMSWDNTDKWDLDHIIPISQAKSEKEIYLLNHYSNFQPLESNTNRYIKKDSIPLLCNIELKIVTENNLIKSL